MHETTIWLVLVMLIKKLHVGTSEFGLNLVTKWTQSVTKTNDDAMFLSFFSLLKEN